MGQKVNPVGFRLSQNRSWRSKWFAKKSDFAGNLIEDLKIRQIVGDHAGPQAAISQIQIERGIGQLTIAVYTARPGILIGRGGKQLETLRLRLARVLGKKFKLDVLEVKKPDLDAAIVAQSIGVQISKRMPYRRTAKQTLSRVMSAGALGARITVSGRLDGAEIARKETFTDGSIPLTTLKAEIDYAVFHARTTYGVVGVRVWVNRGERS